MANTRAVDVEPVKVRVPSEAPVTLPVPNAPSVATCTVPFRTLVPPAYVLLPLPRVRIPEPFMVRPLAPPIAPLRATAPEPLTVKLLTRVSGALIVTLLDELDTIDGTAPLLLVTNVSPLPPRV